MLFQSFLIDTFLEEREKIVLLHCKLARRRHLRRFWAPVLTACVACFLLFHVLIGISVVSGVSMMPSQNPGDLVLYLRQWVGVELGDMVVLSGVTEVDMVKRVVGVSGDEIAVTEDGHITRNGLEQSEPTVWYRKARSFLLRECKKMGRTEFIFWYRLVVK